MAERSRRIAALVFGLVCTLVGAGLAGFGIGRSTRAHPAALTPAVYTQAAGCAGCAVVLSSVEAQARPGSSLLIVRGTWPSSVSALHSDVRLEAAPASGGGAPIDMVVRPASDGQGFVLVTPIGAAPAVAFGLAGGALLVDIPTAVLTPPFRFAVGTWDGHAYTDRLPASSELAWSGSGAPSLQPLSLVAAPAPPAPSTSTSGSPPSSAPTTPRDPVTALADGCASIPSGSVPGYLQVAAVTMGTGTDPRLHVPAPYVAIRSAQPVGTTPRSLPPFSFVAVVLPAGAASPAPPAGPAVDRSGTLQLWMTWDGTAFHKAVRTWDGHAWSTATDAQAGALTAALTVNGAEFYDTQLTAGVRVGAITAGTTGCSGFALDATLVPQQDVRP